MVAPTPSPECPAFQFTTKDDFLRQIHQARGDILEVNGNCLGCLTRSRSPVLTVYRSGRKRISAAHDLAEDPGEDPGEDLGGSPIYEQAEVQSEELFGKQANSAARPPDAPSRETTY